MPKYNVLIYLGKFEWLKRSDHLRGAKLPIRGEDNPGEKQVL